VQQFGVAVLVLFGIGAAAAIGYLSFKLGSYWLTARKAQRRNASISAKEAEIRSALAAEGYNTTEINDAISETRTRR